MTIDRRTFWTDVASGFVLIVLSTMFKPQVIAWTVLLVVSGFLALLTLDKLAGGSALEQLAAMITELIGSR